MSVNVDFNELGRGYVLGWQGEAPDAKVGDVLRVVDDDGELTALARVARIENGVLDLVVNEATIERLTRLTVEGCTLTGEVDGLVLVAAHNVTLRNCTVRGNLALVSRCGYCGQFTKADRPHNHLPPLTDPHTQIAAALYEAEAAGLRGPDSLATLKGAKSYIDHGGSLDDQAAQIQYGLDYIARTYGTPHAAPKSQPGPNTQAFFAGEYDHIVPLTCVDAANQQARHRKARPVRRWWRRSR